MNLLEKHFDLAFAAPDGIQKLRELILTLAMQGKLVPQDPDDQPASELLKEIEAEKQRLVKEGKIKQPKPLPEIKLDEVPYKLPKNWEWVRLGSISTKLTDGSHNPPKDSGNGYPMLSSQNVNFGKIDFLSPSRHVSEEDFHVENKRTNISPGDVLLTIVASLGRPAVVPHDAPKFVLQRSVAVIDTPISPDFLCKQLGSPLCTDYYLKHGKGTAQKGIYLGKLSEMLIALPPLAEQHRIVAKTDRLMARCDELEKLRAERNQKRITIHTAACDRLLTAKESDDFSTAWRFITQHFGELYSVKENVAELRKAILQLAVMGKLVPQDPNDEPASELLRTIKAEKQKLVREGKIKQSTPLPEIKIEEVPAQLPQGWVWGKIDTIVRSLKNDIRTGPFGSSLHKADHRTEGIPVWGIESINKNGSFSGKNKIYVSAEKAEELSSFRVQGGDIIVSRSGTIGELCQLPDDAPYGLISTNLMKISLDKQVMVAGYFCLLFKGARSINAQLTELCSGSTRLFLTQAILSKLLFPIPPLAEQHRIVAKIYQLMALCDHLDHQIDAAASKQTTLLNAVMAQV
ncbi:restriction endonuclease subunit S [Trichocoleus sp. FACHB-262]|uniref:restriction endonuclease subunit S n=1 Tax=Trichocoleus sp. FACHB-262 TaxID=2692869 RepID=UPI00168457EC|nr:restriction endonuclease subunit S [Trichocoleus sp. FACHB-262]MBD2121366.1 restriction endonuclease subunit S [Trichocoleus sp. FACHB-262]